MKFQIRKADQKDLPGIMKVMEEAASDQVHPDWFVSDDEAFVAAHLEKNGFVMVSETENGEIGGFFLVKYPNQEENLGRYLGFTEEQLKRTVVMDSAAVRADYRGNGLQGKMLEAAENRLDPDKWQYLLCTVHPENRYSLANMKKHGYEIKTVRECYGGLIRCILMKKIC